MKTTITTSELFAAAHKTAKAAIQPGDNYQATFGAALKMGYRIMREQGVKVVAKTPAAETSELEQIKALPMVESANVWQDRIYINVRGNGGNYRGERTAKIFIRDGSLTVQLGKGTCSSVWAENVEALKAIYA